MCNTTARPHARRTSPTELHNSACPIAIERRVQMASFAAVASVLRVSLPSFAPSPSQLPASPRRFRLRIPGRRPALLRIRTPRPVARTYARRSSPVPTHSGRGPPLRPARSGALPSCAVRLPPAGPPWNLTSILGETSPARRTAAAAPCAPRSERVSNPSNSQLMFRRRQPGRMLTSMLIWL